LLEIQLFISSIVIFDKFKESNLSLKFIYTGNTVSIERFSFAQRQSSWVWFCITNWLWFPLLWLTQRKASHLILHIKIWHPLKIFLLSYTTSTFLKKEIRHTIKPSLYWIWFSLFLQSSRNASFFPFLLFGL